MAETRRIEIFSAGCPMCEQTINLVNELACPSCEVRVHDMHEPSGAQRAKELGVQRVPAVAVNGKLASCCEDGGVDEAALKQAGVGQPLG